jgi:hypothetical protein
MSRDFNTPTKKKLKTDIGGATLKLNFNLLIRLELERGLKKVSQNPIL